MTDCDPITGGLSAFLDGLMDYAGIFPPASLPLDQALRNYLGYINHSDAWMLGRFILPVARTDEAAAILESHPVDVPVRIAMLGKGGSDWTSFFSGLEAEIDQTLAFRNRLGSRVETAVFETRLPGAELEFQIRADALIGQASGKLNDAGFYPYFEIPSDEQWQPRARRALKSMSKFRENHSVRLKIRTGGIEKESFPPPRKIAWALAAASAQGTALKCTAGLHHPIRKYREEVSTEMHGFVNVFTAAVLAHAHSLSEESIVPIVADEVPGNFTFTGEGLAWCNLGASLEEIAAARRQFAVSFGSCSFDEPREDLKELGWI